MRIRAIAFVMLIALAPFAQANVEASRIEVANLVQVRSVAIGTVLVWAPMVGVESYDIYRATTAGEYTYLDSTHANVYVDRDAPRAGYLDYIVVTSGSETPRAPIGYTAQKGDCVGASTAGVTITARNCMPSGVWIDV